MITHMSVNIEGFLRQFKNKSMAGMLEDDNGKPLSSKEVRKYLNDCLKKGWKLIPAGNNCDGFDYFGGGCPSHEEKE